MPPRSRPSPGTGKAGATVAESQLVLLRDLNMATPRHDGRRIEVIAKGLPLWGGVLGVAFNPLQHVRGATGLTAEVCVVEERTYCGWGVGSAALRRARNGPPSACKLAKSVHTNSRRAVEQPYEWQDGIGIGRVAKGGFAGAHDCF